jgi:hypothetical protein
MTRCTAGAAISGARPTAGRPRCPQLPEDLATFYTACANGFRLFDGELCIYGLRIEGNLQPYDLRRETESPPPGSEDHMFYFGAWGDVHPLYLDTRDGSVHGASRESADSLRRWDDLATFLTEETDRLGAVYDAAGERSEPYGSAPEEQEADARGD